MSRGKNDVSIEATTTNLMGHVTAQGSIGPVADIMVGLMLHTDQQIQARTIQLLKRVIEKYAKAGKGAGATELAWEWCKEVNDKVSNHILSE